MNYIVLDLEWNQGNGDDYKTAPVPFEIIEIGAVKLNSDKVMIDEFSELIKPQIYSTMHYYTGKLVHLKMQELKFERPFMDVMKDFLKWCGEDYVFCTWGPLDLYELQRNMVYYGFEPFSDRPLKFYDIQKLFAIECDDEKKRRSLETAVDMLNIEKDIPFHRAFSDAYYTAKVMAVIKRPETLRHFSYDLFSVPRSKDTEIRAFFGDYDKYITRAFDTREAMLSDKEVRSTACYLCKKKSKRVVPIFLTSGKFYLGVSKCEDHGFIKTKIRIRKSADEKYFAVKTQKIVSEDIVNDVLKRYEKYKEFKKIRKEGSSRKGK